jgi:hypothetical protein
MLLFTGCVTILTETHDKSTVTVTVKGVPTQTPDAGVTV